MAKAKNKTFKFLNWLYLLIISFIITISVKAITSFPSDEVKYDNSESGLESANVQGAIDELHNTCSSVSISNNSLYYITTGYYNDGRARSGTLYQCNLNGEECVSIKNVSDGNTINSIHVTKEHLFYSVLEYDNGGLPYNGTLYQCNLNGKNCISMNSAHNSSIDIKF